jgi:hypothetical protein
MKQNDTYIGTWTLVPELCIYEEGQPPLSGTYRISQADGDVRISIDWKAPDGSAHQIEFGAPNDGTRQPSGAPGVASRDAPAVSHLSITRVSPSILDSSAFAGADEVAYARRSASQDGLLLSTVQVGRRADGTSFRNFQVYRRDRPA